MAYSDDRMRPPRQRGRLPQGLDHRARDLEAKWGLSRNVAVQIVQGKLELDAVLQKIQLREKVNRLAENGELYPPLAPQVIAGSWSLEDALFHTRLRARKSAPDYMRCFLDESACAWRRLRSFSYWPGWFF